MHDWKRNKGIENMKHFRERQEINRKRIEVGEGTGQQVGQREGALGVVYSESDINKPWWLRWITRSSGRMRGRRSRVRL